MRKISIEEFLQLADQFPVLDVRSPAEYTHAHIPGSHSLPLFTDEERKIVGTAYKQESREQAIKTGLDYFGVKMRLIVEEVERIAGASGGNKTVLVHCWRGGMRSAGVAWLLDLYGFKVYILSGGYKSFRNWVLAQFPQSYRFKVLGGYTGSGKTEVLKELSIAGETVIDLEGLAHHKGSAFGGLGQPPQPTQEMFENKLGLALNAAGTEQDIWIEDESQRIGAVNLPNVMYRNMRQSPVYFLDVPFEERLRYITGEYGQFSKENLLASVTRIQKRLGGQNTKDAMNYLQQDNNKECFRILLRYYDKYYERGIKERDKIAELLTTVPCDQIDAINNAEKLKEKK